MTRSIKSILAFLVVSSVLFVNGCSTLADARHSEGTGMSKTYNHGFDKVWNASLSSLTNLKLQIASENKSDGYILAQRGMTLWSYGENVALFVKKKNNKQTSVEVVSKKALETNIFAPNWTKDIFHHIELELNR
jgi:hypothetical protein